MITFRLTIGFTTLQHCIALYADHQWRDGKLNNNHFCVIGDGRTRAFGSPFKNICLTRIKAEQHLAMSAEYYDTALKHQHADAVVEVLPVE